MCHCIFFGINPRVSKYHAFRLYRATNEGVTANVLNFYSDASLNPKFGMGAVYHNRWLYMQWNEQFIRKQKPSIEFLELYALAIALLKWGTSSELRNTRVIIFCDNEAVVHMINGMASSCTQCMKLIRVIVLDCLQFNR